MRLGAKMGKLSQARDRGPEGEGDPCYPQRGASDQLFLSFFFFFFILYDLEQGSVPFLKGQTVNIFGNAGLKISNR